MVLFSRYTALFVLIIYAALAIRAAYQSEQVRRLDRVISDKTAVLRIEMRGSQCTIYPKSAEPFALDVTEKDWRKVGVLANQNEIHVRAICLDATPIGILLLMFLFGTPTFIALSRLTAYGLARYTQPSTAKPF